MRLRTSGGVKRCVDVSVHMAQGLVLQRGSRWGFTRVERFLWWAATRVGGFYQVWQKVPSLPNKRGLCIFMAWKSATWKPL